MRGLRIRLSGGVKGLMVNHQRRIITGQKQEAGVFPHQDAAEVQAENLSDNKAVVIIINHYYCCNIIYSS